VTTQVARATSVRTGFGGTGLSGAEPDDVLAALGSSRDGLSSAEAELRHARCGDNVIGRRHASPISLLWCQLRSPRSARVSLSVDDHVTLIVSDDGTGLPAEVLGGRGLANMRDRSRMLGGELRLERSPEGGTVLVWRVASTARLDVSP
jgi:hypothetical protein